MSRQGQQKFLTTLQKKLLRESKHYRQKTADKQTHHFSVSKKSLNEGIRQTVSSKFKSKSDARVREILSIVDKDITTAIEAIKKELHRLEDGATVAKVYITFENPNGIGAVFYATKTDSGRLRNIYRQAAVASRKHLNVLAEKVNKASIKITGKGTGTKSADYFHVEHGKNEGVAESLVRDALEESILDIPDISFQQAKDWLEAMMPEITLIRDTKTSRMNIHIGPKLGNLAEGRVSRQEKKEFSQMVDDLVKVVTSDASFLVDAPGSDSFRDIQKKKVLKAATDPFTKIKNTRVKAKTKIKHGSKTPVKSKRKKAKISDITPKPKPIGGTQRRSKASSMDFNPLQMIAMLNKQLPDTIRKNMVSPGLVNRTGRFSESARVTDIVQTPKGFPSVGYTYQKNPYEVFEMGAGDARWATPERDPRTLIDRSIRELATQFAIGRFYTRRT
ncbi:hypothetical protein N9R80_00225 [bacterium]|nr:hypothetical protein [bacterium]